MTEPTTLAVASASSISLAAFLSLWLGPHYGPYAAILFAAFAGAIWGVSAVPTITRLEGAGLFLRFTITSVVLVSGGTAIAGSYLSTPFESPIDLSILVAFTIAAIGDRWKEIFGRLNPLGLLKPRGKDQ